MISAPDISFSLTFLDFAIICFIVIFLSRGK
jgi:hypothetical protein